MATNVATIDNSVVRRAQEGDADAFAALFHAHKARVYCICLRMTKDVAEAEDLTQDVFLHIFRKLSGFRGDSALSTWLHRVTVNTVLMHFRKKSLPQVSLDNPRNDENGKPTVREFHSEDLRLSGSVDRITLSKALEELPDGYRNIFLMHEVAGYEHQEIAQLLGCSIGNSKSQLHKARQQIRKLLLKPADHADTIAVESVKRENASTARKRRRAANPEVDFGAMHPFAPGLEETHASAY